MRLALVRHVADGGEHAPAAPLYALDEPFEPVLPPGRGDDRSPFARERLHRRLADTARSAGHYRHLAVQPARHTILPPVGDRKSTRLNSSHANISYAVFC